jgi:RNA polymerase sigma-70 factor (ECF subfamily)
MQAGCVSLSFCMYAEEQQLAARVRAGDTVAFEDIHRASYGALIALAYGYLGSVEAARDIVADVFLNLWQGRADWRPRHRIHSYLCGAVRNRCLNDVRARRVRDEYAVMARADNDYAGVPVEPIDVALEKADLLEAVWRAVEKLPSHRKELMVLRWKHELSFEEIAEVMNTNVPAVHNLLGRTLKTLREMLPGSFTSRVNNVEER